MSLDLLRRREIPVVLTALITLIVVLGSYTTIGVLKSVGSDLKVWATLIIALSVGVAAINLFRYEGSVVMKRGTEWIFSLWTIVFTFICWGLAILPGYYWLTNPQFGFVLLNIIGQMDGTFWALGGIAAFSGAFRAYRIRSLESGIMVTLVLMVVIWNIPGFMNAVPALEPYFAWAFDAFNLGGNRAVQVTEALGVLAVCIRTMFGRERGFYR